MSQETNIRQLVINKLTDAQYEQAVKNADELYLTPDSGSGGGTDLPDQTGQSGKFLTTNGSTLSWGNVPAGTVTSVRVQAGTGLSSSQSTAQNTTLSTTISIASGYKLPTTTEWNNNVLPSQSGNEGKFLTTNGSTTSWTTISGGSDIDNSTITENASNQIQTVGIKDVRTDNTIKTWTGTKAQYDALTPSEWSTATQDTNLGNRNWYNLVYDGSKYIALSTNGYISTSTDGETWTTATQNATLTGSTYGGWYTLAYGGSKFVTLSDSEYVSTSTNGTTWTTPSYNSTISTQDNYKCLVYGNNKFVAISDGGFVTTSTNGTTWTTATSTGLHDFYALTYDGSKFIALNTSGYICTSTDGTTWTSTQISSLNRYSWYNLIYDGNKLTALTDNGYISTSTDGGFTWTNPTLVNNLANKTWYAITYDGSKFIAISTDGYISTKNEGAGIQSNTLYNIENYGLYLGSTEIANVGGGGGTSDYTNLTNKPSINSITLSGDQTGSDLGLVDEADLEELDINNIVPTQTGNSGKFLTTNGSTVAWAEVQGGGGDSLPDQTGQEGKFLTTNGSTASWADVQDSLDLEEMILEEAIPDQSGQNGKFLTTNGTTTAWATVQGGGGDSLPDQSGNDGKFLMTNGSTPSWSEVEDALDLEEFDINNFMPGQAGQSGKFLSTNGSSVFWSSTEGGGGSGYVPMPTVTTLTNTTYSLTVAENTIYEFTNAITSLTISSAVQSYLESFIYFTTGSSITFVDSSTLKWGGGSIPSLETNTTYCIAIKNGLAEIDKFGR